MAIALTPRLNELGGYLNEKTAEDGEAIHELRRTLMRLRVWLELGGWRLLDGGLRQLRRRAGEVRDRELQLARRPPHAVATALEAELDDARGRLRDTLARTAPPEGLSAALHALPALEVRRALRGIARLARRALRRGRRTLARGQDPKRLHVYRRILRRLWFALEWVGKRPRRIERLLAQLGKVADRIAALRQLEQLGVDAPAYRAELEAELDRHTRRSRRRLRRALSTFRKLGRKR